MARMKKVVASVLVVAGFALITAYAATLYGCGNGAVESNAQASSGNVAQGERIFRTKCQACHTVGEGDRVGPDLKGVATRRDDAWLRRWIKDPTTMSREDPVGQQLLKQFRNVPMPPPDLADSEIDAVLAYIESRS